jgi:hypothetical protein
MARPTGAGAAPPWPEVAEAGPAFVAHVGHWIWELLVLAPLLLLALALLAACDVSGLGPPGISHA